MSNFDNVHKQNYCTYYIKYYPEFKRVFGSDKAAIIFERLEYWSQKYEAGFWKFFEPCKHPLYRQGDSWEEEIGFSRKVFTKVFPLIGIHYKSKSEFLQQGDPFQDKLYVSYYDRKTNRTYFLRNHQFVKDFLQNLWSQTKNLVQKKGRGEENKKGRSWNCPMGRSFTRAYKDISSSKEILTSPPTPSNSLPPSSPVGRGENVEEKKKDNASEEAVSQEMVTVWNQKVPEAPLKTSLSWWQPRKLIKALKESFNNSPEEWEAYCERIAANGFLMGGGVRGWKATLLWAIRPENIEKVRKEGYFSGQKEPISVIREREKPLSGDEIEGSPLWQSLCLSLSHSIGSPAFRSWFQDVVPVDLEGEFPQLRCASVFRAQWIQSHFGQSVDMVFRKALPKVRGVEIVCWKKGKL